MGHWNNQFTSFTTLWRVLQLVVGVNMRLARRCTVACGHRLGPVSSEFLGTKRCSLSNFRVFYTNKKNSVPHCLCSHKRAFFTNCTLEMQPVRKLLQNLLYCEEERLNLIYIVVYAIMSNVFVCGSQYGVSGHRI